MLEQYLAFEKVYFVGVFYDSVKTSYSSSVVLPEPPPLLFDVPPVFLVLSCKVPGIFFAAPI